MATIGLPALKNLLSGESVKQRFQQILGDNAASFVESIIDIYNDKEVSQCDINLVMKECLRAATMHLPINRTLGYAHLITFNNTIKEEYTDDKGGKHTKEVTVKTPTLIPSKKGYIQLAMRTGKYKCINADTVFEGELVSTDKLTGEIDLSGKRKSDTVIGYFAHFTLINGFTKTIYMTVRQMARFAKTYSPSLKWNKNVTVESLELLAGLPPSGMGWLKDFDGMGEKTCLRRLLSNYGILSTEMQIAFENESAAESAAQVVETPTTPTQTQVNVQDIKYEDVTAAEPTTAEPLPQAQPQAQVQMPQPQPQPQPQQMTCAFRS